MPRALRLVFLLALAGTAPAATPADEFARENTRAMERMMLAMHVGSSGDVDRDFVAMMTPHHQGAIDMARLEIRYGNNERLRRMAQEIIVIQQQEIDAMARAIAAGSRP